MAIQLDTASPKSLEGSFVIVRKRDAITNNFGRTYTHHTFYHNGAEWLLHTHHTSEEDAMAYIAKRYSDVVAERGAMKA